MMAPFSEKIVLTILPDWPQLPAAERVVVATDCAAFVRRSFARAPAHVRLGIALLGTALGLWLFVALSGGDSSGNRRAAALAHFKRLGPAGIIVRLFQSMTVLAFYEHPLVVAAMSVENPRSRQLRFRAHRSHLAATVTR